MLNRRRCSSCSGETQVNSSLEKQSGRLLFEQELQLLYPFCSRTLAHNLRVDTSNSITTRFVQRCYFRKLHVFVSWFCYWFCCSFLSPKKNSLPATKCPLKCHSFPPSSSNSFPSPSLSLLTLSHRQRHCVCPVRAIARVHSC